MSWSWRQSELKKVTGYVEEDDGIELLLGEGWLSWKGVDFKFFTKNGNQFKAGDKVHFHVQRDSWDATKWIAMDVALKL